MTQTVQLRCYAYASRDNAILPVPAHVVGDIAIHRQASYDGSHAPRMGEKGWYVSHIPTMSPIDNARPRNLKWPGNLRDLKRWAARWQELAADDFAILRTFAQGQVIKDRELGERLLDASRRADHTMTYA